MVRIEADRRAIVAMQVYIGVSHYATQHLANNSSTYQYVLELASCAASELQETAGVGLNATLPNECKK